MMRRLLTSACVAVVADALTAPAQRVCRRTVPVKMSWGAEPTWGAAEILSNDAAATNMRAITIAVPSEKAGAHKLGGQFVQVKLGDSKPGFYAIASPPGATTFEFLVKGTDSNGWLTEAKAGTAVELSDVAGKGFDCATHFGPDGVTSTEYDGFACQNILFLAQGSGIAPIRSTIESGAALAIPRPATLYLGVQDGEHCAYKDKFDLWRRDFNVDVIPVHSQPLAGWTGQTGYVQAALKAASITAPRNTGAVICGNKEMFGDCKKLLLDAGVFEGRIRTNF